MFLDLVGSTTLSQQLDPEEYHARVRAYQSACHQVIARYEGHIAQYLGDGVLVYFGYPAAHEDDADRAVRAGLEIITAIANQVPSPLVGEGQGEGEKGKPLQVRIGIHTDPVVVAEVGAGAHTEHLALGETPNLAARVQGQAEPNTVVMSATTERLVQGLFACRALAAPDLKGVTAPLALYHVMQESTVRSRFEAATQAGLRPLVGREHELVTAVASLSKDALDSALAQLADSGLAFRCGVPPEATYTFKHALVQDAAYDSLLKSRRRELHGTIARVLAADFPQTTTTEPELLAHHLTAAGQTTAAIPYWQQAGELASKRLAFKEAIVHLH